MIGYTDYKELANTIPEHVEQSDEVICIVTMRGFTIGEKEVYGTVSAKMIFDGLSYNPVSVICSTLEDGEEQSVILDNDTVLEAMIAAYDRFDEYFNNDNTREVW